MIKGINIIYYGFHYLNDTYYYKLLIMDLFLHLNVRKVTKQCFSVFRVKLTKIKL